MTPNEERAAGGTTMSARRLGGIVLAIFFGGVAVVGCWKKPVEPEPDVARNQPRPQSADVPQLIGEEPSKPSDVSIERIERKVTDGVEFGTTMKGLPGRKWELEGPLVRNLELIYEGKNRILQETTLPEGTYRIVGSIPDDVFPNEDNVSFMSIEWRPVFEAVRKVYEATFGVRITEVSRTIRVYTLTAPNGQPESFEQVDDTFGGVRWSTERSDGVSGTQFYKMSMIELAMWFEKNVGVYVVDETELAGTYKFFLAVQPYSPTVKQATSALEKVGLSLQPAKREVTFLVIGEDEPKPAAP